jgi:hypothetical protein
MSDFASIQLTQGFVTKVDPELVLVLKKHHWHACKAAYSIYACRDAKSDGAKRRFYLHREIIKCPPGHQVHHRDGDTLNNTRANLEICTQQKNLKFRKWRKKP